ncbi:MAG: hypothetical protein KME49_14380 [Brasilonema octagenarum HA4186-MV1]|jgi:hypothetical protein|uniref:Uncharacterized protein n=1 Tax=Brasilonema octagenarum UFV-OR1 TaxID=417115 RepID=A0ABX1MBU5_9CYAN|nr:hypothetical protein [Brasilonema octagenarum]MBW4626646.1 hypothetical protein [Brasilonema octagenarum HA4186-MV1]NMF64966.1 hypothetical protein [Brasilonema octagenarum UFV-OR1]
MKDNQHEQLVTELTPEQGAVIEGGAWLYLYKATAIKAGADFGWSNGDDVYARINGDKTSTTNDVDTGETANFFQWKQFSGTASINLFDSDGGLAGDDDSLGGFTVGTTPTNGSKTKRISGSGSIYDVTYAVYA